MLKAFLLFIAGVFMTTLEAKDKTVCLNMIVKDESKAIKQCLNSVKGLIDYWVIVDTGSTDGTQEIIKEALSGIPGELHEKPWVNFEHNRNEALILAKDKADYLFFIDADERVVCTSSLDKSKLNKHYYYCPLYTFGGNGALHVQMINNRLAGWHWEGVLHEELLNLNVQEGDWAVLENVQVFADNKEGRRSQDPEKYMKDALVLEEALKKDPQNSRHVFYLGQSYFNAGKLDLALQNYEKRSLMGGQNTGEVFWSMYFVGMLEEELNRPFEKVVASYSRAHKHFPTRAEPLYKLANYLLQKEHHLLGYLVSEFALSIPLPSEAERRFSYCNENIYKFGLNFTFGNAAFLMGKFSEANKAYEKILATPAVPEDFLQTVRNNNNAALSQIPQ